MQPLEYIESARKLRGFERDPLIDRIYVWAGAIGSEFNEFVDLFKKLTAHGRAIELSTFQLELGDSLWYACTLLDDLGISLAGYNWSSPNRLNPVESRIAWMETLDKADVRAIWESIFETSELIAEIQAAVVQYGALIGTSAIDIAEVGKSSLTGACEKRVVDACFRFLGKLKFFTSVFGGSMSEIAKQNIEKLQAAYPEGFSIEAAQAKQAAEDVVRVS